MDDFVQDAGYLALEERWYIEGIAVDTHLPWRIPLDVLPLRIGREPGGGLTLPYASVSKRHAELCLEAGNLTIRDLGSTNGTFVGGRRVAVGESVVLRAGDVIHFGSVEFQVGLATASDAGNLRATAQLALGGMVPQVERIRKLRELLERSAVAIVFQPVVALAGGAVLGFEALGRGAYPGLPSGPGELFEIAEAGGMAGSLSRLLRYRSLASWSRLPAGSLLFSNVHPAELADPEELLGSVGAMRELDHDLRLVLEISETAVLDVAAMGSLRRSLGELGIQLAYDDFGKGQARLNELGQVPPDFLKLDDSLLRGIERGAEARHRMFATVATMARDIGIPVIAEGVETAGEAEVCREVGVDYAQGYFFGKPLMLPPAPTPPG